MSSIKSPHSPPTSLKQQVYNYLLMIPKGKVVTYGQIASHLNNPHLARAIGNILHQNPHPEKYPCYKVVNSQGKLSSHFAFGGEENQKSLLEADGIEVHDLKVSLEQYQWHPPSESTP